MTIAAMTEATFQGTVTVNGTTYQVSADLTQTTITPPPSGGGGTTPPPGGGGGTTPPPSGGGGTTPPPGGGGGTIPPPTTNQCYFGLWDTSFNSGNSISGAAQFGGKLVKSITYYIGWGTPFPAQLSRLAQANGSQLYLNMEPWNSSISSGNPAMSDIAKGTYDSYITGIGNAIKAAGNPCLVTFAHEMNGNWYPWGIQAVTPAAWQQAWKHVYQVIKAAAGSLAQMVWCPNNNDVGPVTPYWPGESYVDIAGYDGYLNNGGGGTQTFTAFQQPTVSEIRSLTNLPIWNAECGIGPSANRAQQITQFVSDMHAAGLMGFTWFNEGTIALSSSEIAALTTAVNAWNNG